MTGAPRRTSFAISLIVVSLTACGGGGKRTVAPAPTTTSTTHRVPVTMSTSTTSTTTPPPPTTTTTAGQPTDTLSGNPPRFGNPLAVFPLTKAQTYDDAKNALQSFASHYEVTIAIPTAAADESIFSWTPLQGATDLSTLRTAGVFWIEEFSKYPRDWITYAGLNTVSFVKTLNVAGQNRAAVPDWAHHRVLYAVDLLTTDEAYAREVIHHEFFHVIYTSNSDSYSALSSWSLDNPPGFHYGNGGASCYTSGACSSALYHPTAGFVSGYAESAVEEDQAETYAYLITTSYNRDVRQWVTTDSYLAKKVALMEAWMQKHSPEMNATYFSNVAGA